MDREMFETDEHKARKKRLKEIIETISKHMPEIREKFGVKELGIFAYYDIDEEIEGSDLDVLVEFEEGKETLYNYMDLKFYIEDLVGLNVYPTTKSPIDLEKDRAILRRVIYVENKERSVELYLKDILNEIENIQTFIEDVHNFEEFSKNKITYYAVLKSFGNIGEAVKNIPNEVRQLYPIEWERFAGFRDVLYYEIDPKIVWWGIHNELPELKFVVKYLLKALEILKELKKELKSEHYGPPLDP